MYEILQKLAKRSDCCHKYPENEIHFTAETEALVKSELDDDDYMEF